MVWGLLLSGCVATLQFIACGASGGTSGGIFHDVMGGEHALVEDAGDEDAMLCLTVEEDVIAVFEPAEVCWIAGVWTTEFGSGCELLAALPYLTDVCLCLCLAPFVGGETSDGS